MTQALATARSSTQQHAVSAVGALRLAQVDAWRAQGALLTVSITDSRIELGDDVVATATTRGWRACLDACRELRDAFNLGRSRGGRAFDVRALHVERAQ